MPYRAPVPEITFCLEHVVGYARVTETDRFSDATPETVSALLTEAGRICEEVLAPLNRAGDLHPTTLENGVVRTPPGYAEGYRAIAEAGFAAITADPHYGGLGLPQTVATAVNEMMGSACLALQMNPLMTQGQIEALEHHASDEIKALYLPKLTSGEWCGTMNLTEPQAGSDVGALKTRAEPKGDGTYAITGQKIYISWGDNDFTENVCHLVLARLPDGAPGTKGISLFLVPKRIPDADGTPGIANSLKVVSLEHKLGLHGSPTCVMQYEGATGWLVGEPHGGIAAMFTMMNNARLGVGVHGLSIAEAATQHALAYAADRVQGRSPIENGTGTILDHADVRRMLTGMKAETFAARALALDLAVSIDLANVTGDPAMTARAAVLTPICKAYGTDTGISVADTGIQVHGGMGFIEETGAAQFYRDGRVSAIYEGTNGIQAMDLTGRKMMDGGVAAHALIDEIEAEAKAAGARGALLVATAGELRAATDRMLSLDLNDRFAGAVPYQHAFALALGGLYHLRAAQAEGEGPRTRLAQSFMARQMAAVPGLLAEAGLGAADLYALSPEDLVA
ncbi:3-methylmercaptopropionyl-CoA dehydrogenase (DmdC) [Roseibacterium elongatum DSM 19469]|uniref:3-methylmercaptopropionyl-CoA dehydrogenase n=1 Tax=Roseicyclus elongatus DSM 19469 TaxID=1294273 RepID=W8RPK9_9RHOB|nr:acyl-CoA dehydrogenase [Roseibacterium elongatum]AHM03109.1 3-methylmercaptopropionyl-CoA dehydrogenase (DmdC) [Roseibacterium elongatum DSM 19469]